mmetsp:Transcript_19492/g.22144  ORF Transcript_19492/g.22144 Transcript_19492/m.22144 type:complete len:444 (-) Transcript_19492:562-1893(-)|eukprot:CAMPEP_0114997202 /NCGR_PEP_ID=MMETSP0216-20121206/14764_1 /TAXON_ID=223996 /ORGANISM="Protocruzia adherens, Strain Boccale" /LENGTH=443 /DNA_ID=CAMNT_0002361549 /DNA_START=672 /DNA_END=2003 /DNA_ORIENTATION=-
MNASLAGYRQSVGHKMRSRSNTNDRKFSQVRTSLMQINSRRTRKGVNGAEGKSRQPSYEESVASESTGAQVPHRSQGFDYRALYRELLIRHTREVQELKRRCRAKDMRIDQLQKKNAVLKKEVREMKSRAVIRACNPRASMQRVPRHQIENSPSHHSNPSAELSFADTTFAMEVDPNEYSSGFVGSECNVQVNTAEEYSGEEESKHNISSMSFQRSGCSTPPRIRRPRDFQIAFNSHNFNYHLAFTRRAALRHDTLPGDDDIRNGEEDIIYSSEDIRVPGDDSFDDDEDEDDVDDGIVQGIQEAGYGERTRFMFSRGTSEFEGGIDLDGMSYEQLLELGERMGKVSRGLENQEIAKIPTMVCRNDKKDKDGKIIKCTICQYDLNRGSVVRTLPCAHLYHRDCVDEWLKIEKTCPVCMREIGDKSRKNSGASSSGNSVNLSFGR